MSKYITLFLLILFHSTLSAQNSGFDVAIDKFESIDKSIKIQGESIRLIVTVKNTGLEEVATRLKIYKSSNITLDDKDEQVFDDVVKKLSPGATTSTFFYDFADPDFLGTVHFIAVANPDEEFEEVDRKNNTKVLSFSFRTENIDLSADSISLITTNNNAGSTMDFNLYHKNIGTTGAKSGNNEFQIGYYISEDSLLDSEDTLVYTSLTYVSDVRILAQIRNNYVTIPISYKSFKYVYLIAVLDVNNQFTSENKSNNTVFKRIDLGIEVNAVKQSILSNVALFPTEIIDNVTLKTADQQGYFEIYDLTGNLIMEDVFVSTTNIDMSMTRPGAYLIKVVINDAFQVYKVLKN